MLYPAAGIIAEYNPLHKGHIYHIEKTRELCRAEAVVAVLSSNFVQRGEAALADKWTRAEMALSCGVDLALELPVTFSAHNAGVFANGAVDILAATQSVTHLSFGAENPHCLSDNIINILLEEPEAFKQSLKKNLNSGLSFVEARARAAEEAIPGSAAIFAGSNNILALSYMERIKQKKYAITPMPLLRTGAAYNSAELSEIPSAAAIRKAIKSGDREAALDKMPAPAAAILRKKIDDGRICANDDALWKILRASLLRTSPRELGGIAEISEGIEFKMKEAAISSKSFSEWLAACTSKRYPAGRIRRAAIHILLGLDHWTNRAAQRLCPPYIRVLGMNEKGRKLLHEMRERAALPIVTTYGKAARLSRYAAETARFEALACELWEELIPNGRPGEEHKRRIIIV